MMRRRTLPRRPLVPRARLALMVVAALLVAVVVVSLSWGAVAIPIRDTVAALLSPDAGAAFTVRRYRLPRVLCALLGGAALAVAGVLLQAALRNPLGSPDVLGVNKGAGLGAVLVIMLFPAAAWTLPVAAVTGALAAVGVLFAVVDHRRGPAAVALSGIAVGAVMGAAMMYVVVSSPGDVNRSMIWLAGSLYGSTIGQAQGLAVALAVLLPMVIAATRVVDLVRLSDESVLTLGRNPVRLRAGLVVLSALLTAAAVSVVGTVGFLGLLAPHLASALGGHRPRHLVPLAALLGSLLLAAADLLGRALAPPSEIPAGIVIAIIGVPYVLYTLWRGSHVR